MGNIKFVALSATFVIIALIFIMFSGCGNEKKPLYKIGVAQCSSDEWRDKMNAEMQREMLFHGDSYIEIVSAEDDNELQIKQIQNFIDRDFDLIIVAPNESEALTPIVTKAYAAGIPVIIFDRRIANDSFTTYIDLENKNIGKSAAYYAKSLLGDKPGKVLEITGLLGSTPAQERHQGFIEGLAEFPSISLVGSFDGQWDFERTYQVTDSVLEKHPDINLIYAHNDFMALGVDSLLRERGRRDIKVLGTDASPGQGIEAVRDGKIDATFIYPTEGHRIIETAFEILEGKPYEKIIHVPALASVDKTNADILLRQNELLKEETDKVLKLDTINETLEKRHNTLSHFLNAVVTLSIILLVILILVLFLFFRNRKLQKELKEQNRQLIEERDKQINLFHHLDEVLTKEDDFYSRFMSIIKAEYADSSLNTEILAGKLNLGGAQLTRKIKALTHFSPVEILRNYRLEQAHHLLLTTDRSINEITYSVGFSSAPYLTKCFREHFGITPSELRNHN